MFKLFKMRAVTRYDHVPFGMTVLTIPYTASRPECEAKPTGRWKIKVTEGKEPELYLEVVGTTASWWRHEWLHEKYLEVMEVPDPPVVTEYINECGR